MKWVNQFPTEDKDFNLLVLEIVTIALLCVIVISLLFH